MLEIKGLTCGYDSKFVLQDISFKVNTGELLGVIGPNGSGKTTLLRAVTRVLKSKKGSILFEGKNIWQMGFKELATKIAVVPQGFSGAGMSIEEFVLLGRIPHFGKFQFLETKTDTEIAGRSMAMTDTVRLKDQLIGEISGGERQLALIARALAQEPKLLLLDEPTTHLDITHQAGILNLMRRLNQEFGLTVVMVLHDLNLASEYCHRLILLDKGRLRKIGRPEEVINRRIIEKVYKTEIAVEKNPVSFKPHVFVVSEDNLKDRTGKGSEGEIPSAAPQR